MSACQRVTLNKCQGKMRHAFISILAVLTFTAPHAMCSDVVGRDGFNIYKDHQRGKTDELVEDPVGYDDRVLYFYRTPIQLYNNFVPHSENAYIKRTSNSYKNFMLSKKENDKHSKRSSKAALSYMLQNRQDPYNTAERVFKGEEEYQ